MNEERILHLYATGCVHRLTVSLYCASVYMRAQAAHARRRTLYDHPQIAIISFRTVHRPIDDIGCPEFRQGTFFEPRGAQQLIVSRRWGNGAHFSQTRDETDVL